MRGVTIRILKSSIFFGLLIGLINLLNAIYIPKSDLYYQWARAPYFEERNSLDIIFVGSSHIEWGIDPNKIWDQYGIPTINYAIPGLDMKNSYFLVKEILKYQKPKVFVIDIFKLHDTDLSVTHRICNVFPLSLNKIDLVNSNPSLDNISKRSDYYLPLLAYHSRDLNTSDFDLGYNNIERGHFITFENIKESYTIKDYTLTTPLDNQLLEGYEKITNLLNKEKIPLVFIITPNLKANEETLKQWNAIEEIAKKDGYMFINFNKLEHFNGAGLVYNEDIANDTENNGHLNHLGAQKVSSYVIKLIKENHPFEDKRNDKGYERLNLMLAQYKEKVLELDPRPRRLNKSSLVNDVLKLNEFIESKNKKFKLIFQGDGNLVLYNRYNISLWSSNTANKNATKCIMQGDGNLVIYDTNEHPLWATNTYNHPNSILELQDDGNLVLYDKNIPVWATGTVDFNFNN